MTRAAWSFLIAFTVTVGAWLAVSGVQTARLAAARTACSAQGGDLGWEQTYDVPWDMKCTPPPVVLPKGATAV